ncbi:MULTISPECIES: carbohydrate ABC transporter permease [Halomonadaceae]|uniref:Sugar ABC transporter permease n=2 Tax=Billgrantia TaxID=3137761 RepID=A0AAW4YVF7_9GAMM|nr:MULTISPECIES: sugar ABC transporter permease [Halomonas]MCE8025101.1 sugar ABC transporter permease [Halomonas aerodenitrificans]MCE8028083.1 sugar ABC transporter permease [Halomonas desiderata]MCE8037107.1 sugar ABC transporter permease [Halomonas sp. MCCC 1A11062]MCE8044282.1 sugar ABC transporter permease [Halomonas desiderata]MCE8048856.1 sugar ABC transporter permease [Halomonas desiderata]
MSLSSSAARPTAGSTARRSHSGLLQAWLPKLVLAPSAAISLFFVYGFMLWTFVLSLTNSRMLPSYEFVGFAQYARLMANDRWWVASTNLVVFGGLFVAICLALGLVLAILLDQRIRQEGALRTIYLYPMALSFIVTGVVWKWLLNPGLGIQAMVRSWGFENFRFDWLVDPDMAVYTLVIAAVWQASGFVMALFLAGLRGIDDSILKAAQLDGASLPRIYWRVVIPCLRPVVFSAVMILSHIAIKSFDLVVALTGGGPGYASDLPATFMYAHAFTRAQIGLGSASAMLMLGGVLAILIPYLYSELRSRRHG